MLQLQLGAPFTPIILLTLSREMWDASTLVTHTMAATLRTGYTVGSPYTAKSRRSSCALLGGTP